MADGHEFESIWTDVSHDSLTFRIHALRSHEQPGHSPPLLFIPGLGVSARAMLPTARLLTGERQVFAIDLPSHGGSDNASRALDLEAYADILAAWLEAAGFQQAVWIGHSFGAQVLVELATRRPELVERLVLISLTVDANARQFLDQSARLLLDATRERPSLLLLLARDYLETGLVTLFRNGRLALRDRVEQKLPAVQAPTLVVRGGKDPLVPDSWAREVVRLLPKGRLAVVPGAPHAVQYAAPADVAEEIRTFVSPEPTAVA
jgi:2-hydroxy-6-oxonona-2,4-dienedioate hydrolase